MRTGFHIHGNLPARVDRGVNRVRLIAGFTAAWSLMTALCGITRNFAQFFGARMGVGLAQAGLSLGLLTGICGAIGTWAGGWQGTRFGRSGLHMMLWPPIIGVVLCAPLYIAVLHMGSGPDALMLALPITLGALWTAPSIALTQSLAPVAMRARASAVHIVAANLIGVSMGPLAAGLLSDWFATLRGGNAALGLRDALVCITAVFLLGALHWTLAARALRLETGAPVSPG